MSHLISAGDYLVAFLLDSLPEDDLPDVLAGSEITTLRLDPERENPEFMRVTFGIDVTPQWYEPGARVLCRRVLASSPREAVRAAWRLMIPAVRLLSAYTPYPLGWGRPRTPRSVAPTGLALVVNENGWEFHRYNTWLAMSVSADPVADWNRYRIPWDRITAAANVFYGLSPSLESRTQLERAFWWFERFKQGTEFAANLVSGWHSLVPLVVNPGQGGGVVVDRLVRLARQHGHVDMRPALLAVRAARDEIAHEASTGDLDPLAVDSVAASTLLQVIHLAFLMATLFYLEAEPVAGSLTAKWQGVRAYRPSLAITESMVQVWLTVAETFS